MTRNPFKDSILHAPRFSGIVRCPDPSPPDESREVPALRKKRSLIPKASEPLHGWASGFKGLGLPFLGFLAPAQQVGPGPQGAGRPVGREVAGSKGAGSEGREV